MQRRALLPIYILSITISAFLLFLIEPLTAKTLLPILGGSPSVWNTCMVFFQGLLLAGYSYAFLVTNYLSPKKQVYLHLTLIVASLLTLPVLVAPLEPLPAMSPVLYIMRTLLTTIGVPLFILATTSPLLQYWFGLTNHRDAKDPYFLYSASNVGSLLALMSFPFLLEPFFTRQFIAYSWSVSYIVFCGLIMLAKYSANHNLATITATQQPEQTAAITWRKRSLWLMLSFAPSSLLLAVTQYITTNIAATPLLWILPLTLYLITFIIVFARKPIISQSWMLNQLPLFLVFPFLSLIKLVPVLPSYQLIGFHMLGFFALAMICHGELAAKRPNNKALTEFYFWIALGGFLGGVFNSIIAPLIFNDIYEYYIAIILCLALCPLSNTLKLNKQLLISAGVITLLVIAYMLRQNAYPTSLIMFCKLAAVTLVVLWYKQRFSMVFNTILLLIFAHFTTSIQLGDVIWHSRNFFGVSRVYSKRDAGVKFNVYVDGVTMHGAQMFSSDENYQALTYYRPMYEVATFLTEAVTNNKSAKVAIAGLGAGTLSCAFKNAETTFFEINPAVVNIAQSNKYFTYLEDCPASGGVIQGDARYKMAQMPNQRYDIILLDAFGSDAIPTHLLTINAISMYLSKLTPQGVLIFNVSNSQVDIKPILKASALKLDLTALVCDDYASHILDFPSSWVVLTRNRAVVALLKDQFNWQPLITNKSILAWTDDYSNILRVLK